MDGDFLTAGHLREVRVCSGHAGRVRREGAFQVFHSSSDHERVILETSHVEAVRTAFHDRALHLAGQHGRGVNERGLPR